MLFIFTLQDVEWRAKTKIDTLVDDFKPPEVGIMIVWTLVMVNIRKSA